MDKTGPYRSDLAGASIRELLLELVRLEDNRAHVEKQSTRTPPRAAQARMSAIGRRERQIAQELAARRRSQANTDGR